MQSKEPDHYYAEPALVHCALEIRCEGRDWLEELTDPAMIIGNAADAAMAAVSSGEPGGTDIALSDIRPHISVVLSTDEIVRKLNHDFRGKDQPTNVLSFPVEMEELFDTQEQAMIGDVILAYETVRREARKAGISVAQHTSHLVVHGVLHLMGYDHNEEREARAMEELEVEILSTLGIPNPYGETILEGAATSAPGGG